ncbi:type II secretion system F family protein [Evansella tamaricis]|uniref:Type II secretion system F family protein n=1 Tax=Evansella tamaricis TaxID=2069301 RepID=A0ABS6JBF9_9BACI|nr:type II secretion system F family protein [Evansella tamaricis]
MPQFRYKGRSQRGERKEGVISGKSKKIAIEKLREQGIALAQLEEMETNWLNKEITFGNPVKLGDFVLFLRQFATLLKAGVSIVDSTRILGKQTNSKALASALEEIEEELVSGKAFSDAASKQSKIFPPIFINMVRAGEASGSLEESLEHLAVQFEKQHDTKQKVKSALAYPIVIAVVTVAVVIFLLTSVVPMFASMFEDFGSELPAITVFVLGISNVVSSFWWALLIAVVMLVIGISILRKNPETKYYFDYALLKMPIFGPLLQKAAIARMSRTLSSLFNSAVPILQSLSIVEKVVGNEVISRTLQSSRESLEEGQPMTEPMRDNWVFPPIVVQMISIGEETGSLDQMLGKVAEFYEKEVDYATDRLKSLIEPILIVVLASVVGLVVISIIVPMFQIYNEI